jgi:general secretion pathway protein L
VTKFLRQIAEGFSLWIDCVADAIVAVRGSFASSRTIELVEEAGEVFSVRMAGRNAAARGDAGRFRIADGGVIGSVPASLEAQLKSSRAELVLLPGRFVIRPLELPRRAGEFLEGIIRAQIDRLTPWSAGDAVFGWSKPVEIAHDRMVVTVAATARALVAPLVEAVGRLGADSIVVSTVPQDSGPQAVAIKVFEQRIAGALEIDRVRRVLLATIVGAGLVAGAATAASVVVGGDLQARRDEVAARIAARSAALRANLDSGRDSVLAALERRKHETPSSVIALEALSKILPDHTYVTELRIAGDKMQVTGVTRDAPSLIRLIEQSSHFTRATLFAPTTRSPSEPGDQFHIEARIEPVNTPRT